MKNHTLCVSVVQYFKTHHFQQKFKKATLLSYACNIRITSSNAKRMEQCAVFRRFSFLSTSQSKAPGCGASIRFAGSVTPLHSVISLFGCGFAALGLCGYSCVVP